MTEKPSSETRPEHAARSDVQRPRRQVIGNAGPSGPRQDAASMIWPRRADRPAVSPSSRVHPSAPETPFPPAGASLPDLDDEEALIATVRHLEHEIERLQTLKRDMRRRLALRLRHPRT